MAKVLDDDLDATIAFRHVHMKVYLGTNAYSTNLHHHAAFSIANCGLSSWLP